MPNPQGEVHINFRYRDIDYSVDMVEGVASPHSVKINGVVYAVLGDEDKLDAACKILESVSLEPISSFDDLAGRLGRLEEHSLPAIPKVKSLGRKVLGVEQNVHVWKNNEEKNLASIKRFVAGLLWNRLDNPKSLEGLRDFLGPEKFDVAVQSRNFEGFLSLFNDLSADELWSVRTNENCHPLGFVKTKPYEITREDLANIQHYLDDINFSGVVTLSDAYGTHTIAPTNQEAAAHTSFSMNSVAKIFTGVLALMTMTPEELQDHLHLPPEVLSFLTSEKPQLYEHLRLPSLLQVMSHNGGFGDFLPEYEKAVQDALEKGNQLPVINKPEDLLVYADTTTYPLDSGLYSNLGILLVGLAVQHKCKIPYDQLLQDLILAPAKINISRSKPENGRSSPNDPCKGELSGGPSGGYWTTSEDLVKLGKWFQDQCTPSQEGEKSKFLTLLEVYGKEFYVPEDEEIHHNGCSAAGSSSFSSFLKSGVTIAVLSDQGNLWRTEFTTQSAAISLKKVFSYSLEVVFGSWVMQAGTGRDASRSIFAFCRHMLKLHSAQLKPVLHFLHFTFLISVLGTSVADFESRINIDF